MNCERFEELLIDFMDNEIEPSEREMVKKHLMTCSHCSEKLEEFQEIRRRFNKESLPQPSPQVLATISKRARQEVAKDRSPFWKRWFYSPILVPVLSSALALSVWIYYGQKNIDYSPGETIYSRDAMAKKVPVAQQPDVPLSGNKVLEEIESEKHAILSNPLERGSNVPGSGENILEGRESKPGSVLSSEPYSISSQASGKRGTTQEESGSSLVAGAPTEELVAEKEAKKADETSEDVASARLEDKSMNEPAPIPPTKTEEGSLEAEVIAQGRFEALVEQETREDKEKSKEAKLYAYRESAYNEQLNLALKQQNEGNCEASIKTNEELLKISPPPPNPIKEKAYLSLAGCYEQKGDLENAISNYNNLQQAAPSQTAFAKDRIEALRQKITFLKARELVPSDTEKGQKSK